MKEFFAPDSEDIENNDSNMEEPEKIPKVKKEQSSFIPPTGRDSSLDFYLEAITYDILQNSKKYKYHCNLSPGERKALFDLSHDENIIIKKADKSSSVVIMNRSDYIKEVERQLKNDKYYQKLNEDPSENLAKDITNTVEKIAEKEHKDELNDLVNSNSRTPQFYVLPKIHKEHNETFPIGYPGRPIVSACNSRTENISGFVDEILQPHVKNLDSYVKDTADFLRKLQNVPHVPKDAYLVTLDVTSLYSNIPHDDGIKACEHFLNSESNNCGISTESLCELISTVLTKNHFQFNGDNYLQTMGCAMGTKMSPSYASLFMGKFEEDKLNHYHHQPLIWLRFLDDIFLIWEYSEEELLDFIKYLNNAHPSIKFTYQYSSDKATFLDVDIYKNNDGTLGTSVHVKKTNNHQYIEYSSCHPISCKKGIPFSQAKRYRRIISDDEIFEKELGKLKSYFLERNYPSHIVDLAFQKASSLSRDEALSETAKHDAKMVPYVITYNPSLPNIGEIINKYWGLLALSQKSSVKYVFQHKPILAFKRPRNLADILTHSKLNFNQSHTGSVSACKRRRCTHCKSINESNEFVCSNTNETFSLNSDFDCTSENVIYLITCNKCHTQYVGQTHQKVSKRMNSHRFDIFHYPDNFTNVSMHFNENGHTPNDFSFAPIDKIEAEWPRLLKETYWMHRLNTLHPNGMNSKVLYQIPNK